tara:strand:- start:8985 stop:12422 length:3438 start_codon:yes stop_codon:yes gene_type:complete
MILIKFKNFIGIHDINMKLLLIFSAFSLLFPLGAIAADVPKGAESIALASQPGLSPDGKSFVFVWAGDIWIASTEGGKAKRLTSHQAEESSPIISPDGKSVAFISQRTGTWQVFVMSINGAQMKQITHHTEGHFLMDWYPNGKHLLVRCRRDHAGPSSERFYKISSKGRGSEELIFDAAGDEGRLSPDGTKILFHRGGTGLYRKGYVGSQSSQIWRWDGKEFTKLVEDPQGSRSPRWAADGKSFYYISGKSGAFNFYHKQFEGEKEKQLTHFKDDSVMLPTVSRDGKVLVFRYLADFYRLDLTQEAAEPVKINVWNRGQRAGRQGIEKQDLRTVGQAVFSKDGLEIAFVSGGDLWVMDTVLKEPKRVTMTSAEEREPVFSPDGKSIIYISDDGRSASLCRAKRSDPEKYWWQNQIFNTEQLSEEGEVIEDIIYSPDGKKISMIKGSGDLWISDADGKNANKLISSWNAPRYDWSPDGKWIAYSVYDNNFNRDIWIVPVDGSKKPFNLSRHPDSDGGVRWSPNGKLLAFTGRRYDTETDIYYVWLKKEDEETGSRERNLNKALETMKKGRPKQKVPAKIPNKENVKPKAPEENRFIKALRIMFDLPASVEKKQEAVPPKPESKEEKKEEEPGIDFDGITERIHRISIPDVSERGLFWSPDSKKLAFSAKIKGVEGVFSVEFPDKLSSPALVLSKSISMPRWLSKDTRIVYTVGGVPGSLAKGKAETYSFKVLTERVPEEHQRVGFRQAWRAMRDGFYDESLNNRDWNLIREKYEGMASTAVDRYSFSRAISLMLGELNASHLGFRAISSNSYRAPGWQDQTAHLGVIFDANHEGPGLKIKKVLTDGPASEEKTQMREGEMIMEINGAEVSLRIDLTEVLNGRLDRDLILKVQGLGDEQKQREVLIRPCSYSKARSLVEADKINDTKKRVEELSGGRLGYLYVARMMWSEFQKFEREIYAEGDGKEGLVIDVRNNGGGFTADHLLTVLVPPVHASTVPRGGGSGYPGDRRVYATWTKPIVVLCNERSFSNAEIFSHAIKNLKRGKLVGVPTAGGVISTASRSIMDLGTIRMPGRGWFLPDGQDMELNGAIPDYLIWPLPGELPSGDDKQLDKAVQVLMSDVEKVAKESKTKLIPASQRKATETEASQ